MFPLTNSQVQTLVGQWCDRPVESIPGTFAIYEITLDERAVPFVHITFADGSSLQEELVVAVNNTFDKTSPDGDYFHINPETGQLDLMDEFGLIRSAKPIESKTQFSKCLIWEPHG